MSSKAMLVALNMNGNEIQNFVVQVLAAAPSAVKGKMYYNSVDNKLYYHNGTAWIDLTAAENAFGKIKVGSVTIESDAYSDVLEFVAGNNVTLTADATNDKITIDVTSVQSDWNESDSTDEAYIKNKPNLGDAAYLDVDDNISASSTDLALATGKAVYDFVSEAIAASDAMIFKGTIGAAADNPTITALPTTYRTGWTYRVVTAGTYAGEACEIGDLIIALVDRSGSGNLDSDWCIAQTNIDGAITNIVGGEGIAVSGSGSSRTIASKLKKGTATLTAGQTSVSASVTDMVAYKAFDASTGEELVINSLQGQSSVTFSIASAYTENITIKYLYMTA